MRCGTKGCKLTAIYHVSGVIMRGQLTPGIDNGGFFYSVPTSTTGTETSDLSAYACEEHSSRSFVRSQIAEGNREDQRLARLGQQEASPLGNWRLAEYKREKLPS